MRLLGIGTDIEEVCRFDSHAAELPAGPASKYLTSSEIEEAMSRPKRAEYLASRFAAKEAAMKSLGCGLTEVSFRDFEVSSGPLGAPAVCLSGRAHDRALSIGADKVMVSISHGKEYAVAFAAAVAEDAR